MRTLVNIGIVGATGVVGRMFLRVLEEYNVDCTLRLFASPKSKGKTIKAFGEDLVVEVIKEGSFVGLDYCLFSAGKNSSLKYAPQAVREGAIVIDNSSAYRMDELVPLVVPECNIEEAYDATLIANPNCSTTQAMLPLYVLNRDFGLQSVEYNTYQSVSGSGINGISDLKATRNGEKESFYPYNISRTVIPEIDLFTEDGYTLEEHKMIFETNKILSTSIPVSATCVRVPIERGHVVQMKVVLTKPATLEEVRNSLTGFDGMLLVDDPINHLYPTTTMADDNDLVYVGRIRKDKVTENAFLIYTASDNLRKGAASNTIQIMLGLMKHNESS